MRIFIAIALLLFSHFVTAGCVSDSSGHQICTDANGNIINGGTTSTGSPASTNGCVSNGAGSICTDANGNIINGGTTSTGSPVSTNGCVSNGSGQLCINNGVVSGTDGNGNPITPVDVNGNPLDPAAVSAAVAAANSSSGVSSGLDGASGTDGVGSTSTINILPDFLTPLYKAFTAFCSWLMALFFKVLASFFLMLKDVILWSFDQFLILVTAILGGIGMSSITNLIPAVSIPSDILNVMGLLGLGDCFAILIAAFSIRIMLQLIPFVRLGS